MNNKHINNKNATVGIFTFAKKHHRPYEKCGSSILRGKWYFNHWNQAEEYVEGKKYDVVIFQKVWQPDLYEKLCEDENVVVILDLCDPEHLQSDWPIVQISKMVDAIVVSSEGLYEEYKKIGVEQDCDLVWIDDRIDLDICKNFERKKHEGDAKEVMWYGYAKNGQSTLFQAVPILMEKNLQLKVVAESPIDLAGVNVLNKEHSWDSLPFEFMSTDIVLNPPVFTPYAKYKSKNKTYLAWAFGIPVAHNAEELIEMIDGEKREAESKRVHSLVREQYDVKKSIEQYKQLIHDIKQKKN